MSFIQDFLQAKLGQTEVQTVTCKKCGHEESAYDLQKNSYICSECGFHYRIGARDRVKLLFDKNSFHELFTGLTSKDFLHFPSYQQKLDKSRETTGEDDAVICGIATIAGIRFATFVMEPKFMMASMGSVVGEKVTRIMEKALELKLPMLAVTSSGGARMQESALSLMQMAKTSCACARLDEAGLLYINLITDPTFGGVTASFGTLGDIIVA